MKKQMKRIVGLVLSIALVIGMGVTAMAADFEIYGGTAIADNEPLAIEAFPGRPGWMDTDIYTFPVGTTITSLQRGADPNEDGWRSGVSVWVEENPVWGEDELWWGEGAGDAVVRSQDGYSLTFTRPGLFMWVVQHYGENVITGEGANGTLIPFLVNIVGDTSDTTGTTTAPDFTGASTWALEYIAAAVDNNLVPQNLLTNFTNAITRAEFAALAVQLYENVTGREIAITRMNPFTDTTDINAIKAAEIGVTTGTGNGTTFSPNNTLTREQAATMISRLGSAIQGGSLGIGGEWDLFADFDQISDWARDAVLEMQTHGIMGGVGGGNFAPRGQYTREQSIITIVRLFEIVS